MQKISVLVVDDSALIRQMFSDMLSAEPDIDVVGTAADPYEAREKIKQLDPQVVTLDIEMPKMDGLSFLQKIMTLRPTRVVMASTLTQAGADAALRALEIGAVDYIGKPASHGGIAALQGIRSELAAKVRAAAQANLYAHAPVQPMPTRAAPVPSAGAVDIIAIGASTGGVEALRHVFAALPAGLPPIVVAQHMPVQFTDSFARRLDGLSPVSISEARHGDVLKPGHAYIARGGMHLAVRRRGGDLVGMLEDTPPVSGHKPSVDVLFSSVAETAGARAAGIVMTGMGHDGAQGLLEMRRRGAMTAVQSAASCVVPGMPRSALALGGAQAEIALSGLSAHIVNCHLNDKRKETGNG